MRSRLPGAMKSKWFAFILLCWSQHVLQQSCNAASPMKVYFDSSRREGGKYVWHKGDGAETTTVHDIANFGVLKQYDIMVVYNTAEDCAYLPEELKAIEQFVRSGGGLLLVADTRQMAARKGRRSKAEQRGGGDFSSSRIAALLGVEFQPSVGKDVTPDFAEKDPVHAGLNVREQQFPQIAGVVHARKPNARCIARWSGGPATVAGEYGKGRFIVTALPELFEKVNDRRRPADEEEEAVARQNPLFMAWSRWLAANSPVRSESGDRLPKAVYPPPYVANDLFVIHCIPQLRSDAERVFKQWNVAWPRLSRWLGIENPVQFCRGADANDKLIVVLKPTRGSGHSAGNRVQVSAWSDNRADVIGIFGHETGHKILGGCNHATSEGFANWVGYHARIAAGFRSEAEEKRDQQIGSFRRADPGGTSLDIGLPNSDGRPAIGKWLWVMSELTRLHGDGLTKSYLAALQKNVDLRSANRKNSQGTTRRISMEDIVTALGQAAGADLRPWFHEHGITVNADPSPREEGAEAEPGDDP